MADYLESLLYTRRPTQEMDSATNDLSLNLEELRSKDIKEWVFEEMEAVIHLLLTQIKPFISVFL